MTFGPTHHVPAVGMHAWTEPDAGADPVAVLAPGTSLQLLEQRGSWAHVAAVNGWRGWVDARHLEWGAPPVAFAPAPGGPVGTPPGTNGFAVASLVLGIVWVWWIGSVLALVFGYVALGQINRSGGAQGGRGLAIAGIVLGWVAVAVFAAAAIAVAFES